MSVETIMLVIWLLGWIGTTIFAAAVIGNDPKTGFPAFIWPLTFGWMWPAVLAMTLVVAPLCWLSDRATEKDAPQ